jgi:hypothetical protein
MIAKCEIDRLLQFGVEGEKMGKTPRLVFGRRKFQF